MAGEPTNADIMHEVGKISASLSGVRRELDSASTSRKALYDRIDAQGRELSELSFKVEAAVQVSAQAREEAKKLSEDMRPLYYLRDDLPTMLQGWKELTSTSKKLVWLLSITGVSVIGGLIWFGELLAGAVRGWLGLGPPGS